MEDNISEYTIILNGKTIIANINCERIQGMIDASSDLNINMRVYLLNGELHPSLYKLPYQNLLTHRAEFLTCLIPTFICRNKTWIECVKSKMDFPNIPFKRYTFVFLSNPIDGPMQSPIITTQETLSNDYYIRHFDSSKYLEGYIKMFDMVNIPWQNHVKLLHDVNTPIKF